MIRSKQITISNIVCVFMWAWSGWYIVSDKDEKYKEWIFVGTVTKKDLQGYLIILGPFYLVFNRVT